MCRRLLTTNSQIYCKHFVNIITTSCGKHTYSAVLFLSNLLSGGENETLQYRRADDLVASQLNITQEKVSLKAYESRAMRDNGGLLSREM